MSHARTRTHLIRLGGAALAAGVTLGTVATGGAGAVPATLAGIKAKAATDVTDRVNALNAAIAKVNAAKGLGSGQETLVSYLGNDSAPLQQLDQTIQGDATVQQAAQDFGKVFSDYRVYVLVLPASRIAADADRATTTAIPALTTDATKAQLRVNPGNQTELQPLINDLNTQISTATNATSGLAGAVLAFSPAQWNANNGLLGPSKSSDQAAAAAMKQGRSDVRQIVQDLKGSTTTTTS
jgi:hypothetical protein